MLIANVDDFMMSFTQSILVAFYPMLRFLPFDLLRYNAGVRSLKNLVSKVKVEYYKCKEKEDEHEDSLLKEYRRLQKMHSADPNSYYTGINVVYIHLSYDWSYYGMGSVHAFSIR